MKSHSSIIVSLIIGVSLIITAKILSSSVGSVLEYCQNKREVGYLLDNRNRYQIEIITDKGKNWNGIYVFDRKTGGVKFYAGPESL